MLTQIVSLVEKIKAETDCNKVGIIYNGRHLVISAEWTKDGGVFHYNRAYTRENRRHGDGDGWVKNFIEGVRHARRFDENVAE